MTPLEMLALLAVIAVLLVGVARTTLRKRERRRTPRDLDPDLTPLQLYRTGVSRPAGFAAPRPGERPIRAAEPIPRPESRTAAVRATAQQTESGPTSERFAPPAPAAPAVESTPPQGRFAPPARSGAGPGTAASATRPSRQAAEPTQAAARPAVGASPPVEAQPRPAATPPRQQQLAVPDGDAPRGTASTPAADGTLQLLPGRLEVLSGLGHKEEIRFVKVGNREPSVTFGRSAGEPHLHVRLESPTVSRMHARMRRTAAGWLLSNLSSTNPVVVNGQAMTNGSELHLQDGDRIEMGEVVFQFRAG